MSFFFFLSVLLTYLSKEFYHFHLWIKTLGDYTDQTNTVLIVVLWITTDGTFPFTSTVCNVLNLDLDFLFVICKTDLPTSLQVKSFYLDVHLILLFSGTTSLSLFFVTFFTIFSWFFLYSISSWSTIPFSTFCDLNSRI